MQPTRYEITVEGILPPDELAEFVGMTARYDHGSTVLDGVVRDQAALVGTVARIESLGGRVRRYLARSQEEADSEDPHGHTQGQPEGQLEGQRGCDRP